MLTLQTIHLNDLIAERNVAQDSNLSTETVFLATSAIMTISTSRLLHVNVPPVNMQTTGICQWNENNRKQI